MDDDAATQTAKIRDQLHELTIAHDKLTTAHDKTVAQLKAVFTQQTAAFADIDSSITAVRQGFRNQIADLIKRQERADTKIDAFRAAFKEFVEQDRRDKERLIAHARLIEVRAEIARSFGQYEDVRRNVKGMLLALDGGLTADEIGQLIAKIPSIKDHRYWLASTQNALAAWIRNDPAAAQRELYDARSCSADKTALFFGLLNARYGRFDAADQWFREYLGAQSPERLSREFTVVLDTAMLGVLGTATCRRVVQQCVAWYEHLAVPPDAGHPQVVQWQNEFNRRLSAHQSNEYSADHWSSALAQVSQDWPKIVAWHRKSTVFAPVAATLQGRLANPLARVTALRDRLDRIMQSLVTTYEDAEAGLRLQEKDLLRIIEHDGDTSAAVTARQEEAPFDEPEVNFLTFLNNVALHPQRFELSPITVQLATHLAGQWIVYATTTLANANKREVPRSIPIRICNWMGRLGTKPIDDIVAGLSKSLDDEINKEVARESFSPRRFFGFAGAASAMGIMAIDVIQGGWSWHTTLLAIVTMLLVGFALWSQSRIPERKLQARKRGETLKQAKIDELLQAHHDYEHLIKEWQSQISEADRLIEVVRSIPLPQPPPETSHEQPRPQPPWDLPAWDLKPSTAT